jgi:hypothetical protein
MTDTTPRVKLADSTGAVITPAQEGTDGASAPSPASGGTGNRGWYASLAKVLQDTWDSTNHFAKVSLATALTAASDSITSYPFGHSFSAFTTAQTATVVKSGAGVLRAIIVTGGTAGTITVWDNTAGSGTLIATFASTNAFGTYTFDAAFGTGLTITTGAAVNCTVVYR